MIHTNHVTEETAKKVKLEVAVGICPACRNLSEFNYSGKKILPKTNEEFDSYDCTACGSILNSKYIKWKK
jgi:hypothetical protein